METDRHELGLLVTAGKVPSEEVIGVAGLAARLGIFSPGLAEEVLARLESTKVDSKEFIRGIDAAARLGFSQSQIAPAVALLTNKIDLTSLTSKRLLTLLRVSALGEVNKRIEHLINPKQLTLQEKRLLWDVSDCEAPAYPPLKPPTLHAAKVDSRVVGPHVLQDKKIYWPSNKIWLANKASVRPDAWLLLRGLKKRGIAAELKSL